MISADLITYDHMMKLGSRQLTPEQQMQVKKFEIAREMDIANKEEI